MNAQEWLKENEPQEMARLSEMLRRDAIVWELCVEGAKAGRRACVKIDMEMLGVKE